jgi:hypothetical protein
MRIKEWPVVMTCSLQYLSSTREWLAILPFYSLDRLKNTELVGIERIRRETFGISDGKRSDLPVSDGTAYGKRGGP